jgi:Ca2+-transporting ATPase
LISAIEHPWSLTPGEVIKDMQGSHEGLTTSFAGQRQLESGANTLTTKDREPWYMLFLMQFANPLVYILLVAAGIKAYFKGPIDAAVIGCVLFFMAIIGFIQEMKARKAMEALLSLSAPKAKIRRDGKTVLIDAAEIVPGDLLILDAGDRVAADARIIECANLRINESPFTGESMPVEKDSRIIVKDAPIHDRKTWCLWELLLVMDGLWL